MPFPFSKTINPFRSIGLLFLFSLFITSIMAQCLEGNCQNGEGTFLFKNGQRYVGSFQRAEPAGEGTLFYVNGERYRGQFVNGKPHGQGIYWYPDGSSREGIWQKGKLRQVTDSTNGVQHRGSLQSGCIAGDCQNGSGTYLTPGGAIYVGEFKNGEIHGQGVCTYNDGSSYEGQWVHRFPEGYGIKTWPDGSQFTGQWQRGHPISQDGIYQQANQPISSLDGGYVIQSGCIKGDCKNGQGSYAYADGSRYEGQFRNEQPHGQGIFYYPNGDRYNGQFMHGLPHGKGQMLYANGKTLNGNWLEGGFVMQQQTLRSQGCLSGDCENGFGSYLFKQGDRYEGTFRNGKPDGNGIVVYQNGDRYEGQMAAGAFEGFGTYHENTGGIYEGRWSHGKYLGNTRERSQLPSTYTNEPETKVWALVIGVSAYKHMPALRFPDDDAYRLSTFLQSPRGGAVAEDRIEVLIDEDATRQAIVSAMQSLFLKAGPKDLIILYFSGHGLPGAFLPIDYDGSNNLLTHQEIRQIFDQSRAGYKLCVADACHSGGLLTRRGGQLPQNILNSYYKNLAQTRPGTALIMSSKAEETSLESSGLRQGVFSHFLLRGMKGEADQDIDGVVRVQELFQYINYQVQAYTSQQQSPVIQGDYDPRMPIAVLR